MHWASVRTAELPMCFDLKGCTCSSRCVINIIFIIMNSYNRLDCLLVLVTLPHAFLNLEQYIRTDWVVGCIATCIFKLGTVHSNRLGFEHQRFWARYRPKTAKKGGISNANAFGSDTAPKQQSKGAFRTPTLLGQILPQNICFWTRQYRMCGLVAVFWTQTVFTKMMDALARKEMWHTKMITH